MIDDLDEALRKLLIQEIPIKNNEIDVTFDQPKREWSARLSRPTLNLFLYDIRENQKLRLSQPVWETTHNLDGTVTQRRRPVRIDMHYMITAWAAEPDDEHHLLTRTLMALFRYPHIPQSLLPAGLKDQPAPLPLMVAQVDEFRSPADVWNVLDNEIRPAIPCVVTLAINPYQPITGPVVRTRELRIGQARTPRSVQLDTEAEQFWSIGGVLHSQRPLETLRMTLLERGESVPLQADGSFAIGRLRAGEYTLEVMEDGKILQQFKVQVPSPDYDLEI